MTKRVSALLAVLLAFAACSDTPTSITLDVTYDDAWMLDQLDLAIGGKRSTTELTAKVRVLVPDPWGGQVMTVAVDGVRDGERFAHGETEIELVAGGEARATVELVPLFGPVCDAAAEDQCDSVPAPVCLDGDTLRTATGPGTCVDNVCSYEYQDTECPNGCVDNACVCDQVTEGVAHEIEVTAVTVDRTFKVNGSFVTDTSINGYGALVLRNTVTGDEVNWGSTYQPTYPVQVLAGTYDVFYEVTSPGSGTGGTITVPRNKRARIATAVDVTAATTIDLAVTAVRADRTFEVNGSTVTDTSVNGYGSLYLRNVALGDEVSWGGTYQPSYPVQILAGTYDVFYELESPGSGSGGVVTVPRNTNARIATAVSIANTTPVDLAVTAVKADRAFEVNGMPVPDTSANGYGSLTLRNLTTGDQVAWGGTYQSTYPTQVIAGTYDVFYAMTSPGTSPTLTVPRNTNARIVTAASITTTAPLAIDVAAVKVDRTFKVNGAVLTDTSINGYGALSLRTPATGDDVSWGGSYQTTYPIQVVAGTYDVFYEVTSPGSGAGGAITVPRNTNAFLRTATLTTTTPLAIDVTAVRVDRTFKVNGAILTDTSANGYGQLHLRTPATGDVILWGYSYQATAPVQVIAGTYDVFYEMTSAGSGAGGVPTVPRNDNARIAAGVSLTTASPVDLSVRVVKVDRYLKVNGVLVPDTSTNGYGALSLEQPALFDQVPWGSSYQASARVSVLTGTYDLFYELTQAGTGSGGAVVVPRNEHARITCLELKAP